MNWHPNGKKMASMLLSGFHFSSSTLRILLALPVSGRHCSVAIPLDILSLWDRIESWLTCPLASSIYSFWTIK